MDEPVRQDETKGASTTAAGASNKLFLGGLSWTTTEDTIRQHFSKYGELIEVIVMRDRLTNKPRGFGFVTFKEQSAADKAFQDEHVLDGRTIDAKPSLPHGEHSSPKSKKIFVGGLAPETTEESFRQHFERFGKVVEAQIMVDHTSGRSRGFGFITFAEEASVQAVFSAGSMQELNGKRVEVKAATPKGSGPVGRGAGGPASLAPGMPGRGLGFAYPTRGMVPGGRYPGDYGGWAMPPAGYVPIAGYGGYMPAYGYPGMMMGYPGMQYGAMGYPMHQQTVPGVMPRQGSGQQYQQQQQQQEGGGGGGGGSSAARPSGRQGGGSSSEAPAAAAAGPSRAQRRQAAAAAKAGGGGGGSSAETAANLPDNLTPTAGEEAGGGGGAQGSS